MLFLSNKSSRARQREAENARNNRREIVKALSLGQITKRDLFKWGIFTGAGYLAAKNGLSPFARSAYGAVPTGTPLSPLYGATKFSQRMPRLVVQPRIPINPMTNGDARRVITSVISDGTNSIRRSATSCRSARTKPGPNSIPR
jgi:hypothetical protein